MDLVRNSLVMVDLSKMFNLLLDLKKEIKLKSTDILDVHSIPLKKKMHLIQWDKFLAYSLLCQLTRMTLDGKNKDQFLLLSNSLLNLNSERMQLDLIIQCLILYRSLQEWMELWINIRSKNQVNHLCMQKLLTLSQSLLNLKCGHKEKKKKQKRIN